MATASYTEMYQDPRTATEYDESICRIDDDAVWAAEQKLLTGLIRRHVRDSAKSRAVDFACGTGRISHVVRPLVGELTGIDISAAMLERARSRVPGVEFRRVDVLANPEQIPEGCDLITAFRFVLLAEPSLREACITALAAKLVPATGVMIINTHGNPRSFRMLASLKRRLVNRPDNLPSFSETDMRALAARCGLRVVDASGCGFVPQTLGRVLPRGVRCFVEGILAGRPVIWRFGTNLLFVLQRSEGGRSQPLAGRE
jgi:SAM-dependent methyltransferase